MAYSSGRRIGLAFWFSQELVSEPYWARLLLGTMLSATRDDGSVCCESRYIRDTLLPGSRHTLPTLSAISQLIQRKVSSGFLVTFKKGDVTYARFTAFDDEQKLWKGKEGKGKGKEGKAASRPRSRGTGAPPQEKRSGKTELVDAETIARGVKHIVGLGKNGVNGTNGRGK